MAIRYFLFITALFVAMPSAFGKNTSLLVTPETFDQDGLLFHIIAQERSKDFIFTVSITSKSGNFSRGTSTFPGTIIRLVQLEKVEETLGLITRRGTLLRKLKFSESKGTIISIFSVTKKELDNPGLVFVLSQRDFIDINGTLFPHKEDSHHAFLRDFIPKMGPAKSMPFDHPWPIGEDNGDGERATAMRASELANEQAKQLFDREPFSPRDFKNKTEGDVIVYTAEIPFGGDELKAEVYFSDGAPPRVELSLLTSRLEYFEPIMPRDERFPNKQPKRLFREYILPSQIK